MQDAWLVAAVCTNRAPGAVDATLHALGRQVKDLSGAAGLLVTSGAGDERHAELDALAREQGFGVERVPAAGAAAARNRAVESVADEAVIAFIDDDAIPAPEWLARLAAHWREAPPDVACIGGAILPRWLKPPPRWMSPRLDVVFSLMDRGEGVKELVPGVEDAWSVNASFRAGPLHEVGGFDPTLGPRGDVPLFAEDTEVQLRLANAGYRGLYAGDVRVEHLIGAERMRLREVFRRRFYAGASMRMTGQWSIPDGIARLLAGAGETAAAFLARRHPALAEGIARTGAGAGVLAAPLVRRRSETAGPARSGANGRGNGR
ncbi:MAG: glycosyltransferase family 2 protein [Actinomycetota bacterium]